MQRKPPSKGLGVMERKVPTNTKYAHVEAKLDTGLTINKVKIITARESSKRRDEIFYRITKAQLYELYNEYESDDRELISETGSGFNAAGPRIVTYSESSSPDYEKPYLLVDVRDPMEYNKCHLLQARSFPYAFLRRDQFSPDMYKFKNKEEKLIIVYCDDERISHEFAKTMVDRGTDNIFLLTGGLDDFVVHYPAFVEGDISEYANAIAKASPKKSGTSSRLSAIPEDRSSAGGGGLGLTRGALNAHSSHHGSSSGGGGMLSARSGASAAHTSYSRHSRDDRSDAVSTSNMSHVSNKSVAESVISRSVSRKGRF